jgi:hypothetical protein
MGKATLDITCELLSDLMHLPATASVLYSVQAERPHTIRLVVESPDLPETAPEQAMPQVVPVFSRTPTPGIVTFVSWGI